LPGTGRKEEKYRLPDRWQVEICHMHGYDLPAMTPSAIRKTLDNPVGAKSIKRTGLR